MKVIKITVNKVFGLYSNTYFFFLISDQMHLWQNSQLSKITDNILLSVF